MAALAVFGMLWLLTTIDGVVGHIGWSVVLLSLAVKLLMAPLTKLADRLQASVNRTQALLQPQLAEIRRHYRGEEAHERTLGVYRDHGVSPLYTLKSLVGFLIQIPVFIAAFDMLGENIALDGAAFGWIEDLARPDHWLTLPVVLPFFGGHLNLLPLLMTGITLLTSRLQTDPHLTPELLRAQRLRLYLMAVAFFLLFYTFPAGMVLYWTTNNALHLVRILLRPPGRGSR
ncbi:MAG: YidC/Oxa1 family membrane protein insertase [Gammaproteobacteria bacterium]